METAACPRDERLLRLPRVRERVALSTASIYDRMAKGTFPKPVRIGENAVAWPSSAIDRWIAERIAEAQVA